MEQRRVDGHINIFSTFCEGGGRVLDHSMSNRVIKAKAAGEQMQENDANCSCKVVILSVFLQNRSTGDWKRQEP